MCRSEQASATSLVIVHLLVCTLVTVAVKTTVSTSSGRWRCPDGWEQFDDQCYVWPLEHELTWHQTKSLCASKAAHMLKVDSELENQFVRSHIASYMIWLGLHSLEEHTKWKWESDSTVATYTNWVSGEPNDQDENCARFNGIGLDHGHWGDYACNSRALFTCESPLPVSAQCPIGPKWANYQNSCYYLSTRGVTWQQARVDCHLLGGDLVVIETKQENNFLAAASPGMSRWIGLNKLANKGKWVWLNQTDEVFSAYWNPGQPDNHGVGLQHCAVADGPFGGRWRSEQCESSWPYICVIGGVPNVANCPDQWWGQWSKCYRLYLDPLPWAQAAMNCASSDATLVTIKSKKEQALVNRITRKRIWTGLNNMLDSPNSETFWKWLDETVEAASYNFTFWISGEPRHDGADACVMLHTTSHNRGKWTNAHCLLRKGFICEAVPGSDDKCPEGWQKFQGHCYIVVNAKTAVWWNARWLCHITTSIGSFLVTITSEEEQTFINDKLLNSSEQMNGLWIGLSARYFMNQYTWLDDRNPTQYNNWDFRQPNPVPVQSCSTLSAVPSWRGATWRDVECMELHKAGCQRHALDTFYDFKFSDGVYRVVTDQLPKDTASAVCAKLLGHNASLAVIENVEELAFLQAELGPFFHVADRRLWIEDVDPGKLNITVEANLELTHAEKEFGIAPPEVCHQLVIHRHIGSFAAPLVIRNDNCCNKRAFICEKRVETFDVYDFSHGSHAYALVTDPQMAQSMVDAACKSQFGDSASQVTVTTEEQLLHLHREIKVRHPGGEIIYLIDLKVPNLDYVSVTNVACFGLSFHNVQYRIHTIQDILKKSLKKVDCEEEFPYLCQNTVDRGDDAPFDHFREETSGKSSSPEEQLPAPSGTTGSGRQSTPSLTKTLIMSSSVKPQQAKLSAVTSRGLEPVKAAVAANVAPPLEWKLNRVDDNDGITPKSGTKWPNTIHGKGSIAAAPFAKETSPKCSGSCLGLRVTLPILAIMLAILALAAYKQRHNISRVMRLMWAEDERLTDTPLCHQGGFSCQVPAMPVPQLGTRTPEH